MEIAPMFLFHLWNFIFQASIYPNKIKPLLERIHKSYKNPSLHFRGNIYLHFQLVLIVLYPYNFQTISRYSNIYKNNIQLFSFDEKHFIQKNLRFCKYLRKNIKKWYYTLSS